MKHKLAVALFSILSMIVPQLASAGQANSYPAYRGNVYGSSRYVQAAPWRTRVPVDRQNYRESWNHRDAYYNGRDEYRDDYYNRNNYDDRDHHAGRSVAIIGGSAAAGAAVGAVSGRGKGAAIGALIGGVGGLIADQAVRHHDRR